MEDGGNQQTLSDQFGNGTLKLTTRQAIQIHGVVKQDLKQTMKDIHHAAITTIAASGDATRNVMVSLHPEDSVIHETVFNQARELSRKLEPQLKELGLWDEDISIRMTGCPNGCSRP